MKASNKSVDEIQLAQKQVEAQKELALAKIKANEAKYTSRKHYLEVKANCKTKLAKQKDSNKSDVDYKRSINNLWWVIGVIATLLIISVGVILGVLQPELCDVSTYDWLTIISLILTIVLSIFAIIYTYTSNSQIQGEFEDINIAAHDISSLSKEIRSSVGHYEDLFKQIISKLDNLPQVVGNLLSDDTNNDPIKKAGISNAEGQGGKPVPPVEE